MGTPLPQEYKKPDGSRYLSGTEWEYLNAQEGHKATAIKPEILVYRREGEPKWTPSELETEDDDARAQWKHVEGFFVALRNSDGSIQAGVNDYATPEDFRISLDEHLKIILSRLLEALKPEASARTLRAARPKLAPLWRGSPFPGLRTFTSEDAPIFSGRRREADELVRELSDPAKGFILVVGASGSGKSSLVAAGLLPRLSDNAVKGSKDWLPHMKPSAV